MKSNVKKQSGALFFFKQILLGFLDAFVMIFAGVLLAGVAVYSFVAPPSDLLAKRYIPQTSYIYDSSGQHVLYKLYGEENRYIISHDEIPEVVRVATIAAEDGSFYKHYGIDPVSIIRALKVNLFNEDIRQGGSTITQQLARNAFLDRQQTFKRKFLEAVIALKIERHYTKDQILDMYLNQVPYGSNTYGIAAAAQTFFGKSAKDLTLDEAAFLAALPKAPSYYSPYGNNSKELILRQKQILQQIKDQNMINDDNRLVSEALEKDTILKVKPMNIPISAPHFVFYIIDELEKKYGRDFLETGGLNIYTTLDWDMQQRAEKVVSDGVKRNFSRGATNAGLVAVNPKNGDVLAMVGSRNYFDTAIDGQVNVTLSLRQPGSSFKPFAYATAFEKGYQPETMILDAPTNFGPDGSGRNYIPRNYDGKFHGLLSMREALAQSLNVPAVKTLYLAGIDNTIDLAHRLGITTLNDRKRYGLSLVLGGGEVRLLDMAGAFSVFANDGVRNPVEPLAKIADRSGKIYFEKQNNPQRVLDQQIARKIDSILSDNKARTPIFGPNSPLILSDRPVAAKTGTTQFFKDAWTVGFTPSLAVGVWAGNNDGRPMRAGADGVFVAAPIWHDFMNQTLTLANAPKETFIAYEKSSNEKIAGVSVEKKVKYINVNTGKEVSEKKKKKMDSRDVEEKVEYVTSDGASISSLNNYSSNQKSFAMPDPKDPMYKRWGGFDSDADYFFPVMEQ